MTIGRRIGLVIAHPDDETLFFTPTLTALSKGKHTGNNLTAILGCAESFSVLCLSTGAEIVEKYIFSF